MGKFDDISFYGHENEELQKEYERMFCNMTQEEKDLKGLKKASIIMELTGIDAYKPITNMTVLELYDLIKLAVNRKQQDY